MNRLKPYLIEGLDCSGKKTTISLVERKMLAMKLKPIRPVIGPLVKSPLQWFDRKLSNPPTPIPKGSWKHYFKRLVYLVGPVVDGLFFVETNAHSTIKVSSHLRAQARAIIDNDRWMIYWYQNLSCLNISYGGCTYLTTQFSERIKRHENDIRNGKVQRTAKDRFLNYDEIAFNRWSDVLEELIKSTIPEFQIIDSTKTAPDVLAESIIEHIEKSRKLGLVS